MIARLIVLLCVVLPTAGALAQATSLPAGSSEITGTVTGTNVYVRSGAGQSAYPCAKISSPTTVTVVQQKGDWLVIQPPPGTFSVIAKKFVQPDAGGATGTVTNDDIYVRPGGELRMSDFSAIHGKVAKGDKVAILGEVGDFYKITPPKGAYFYIAAQFVKAEGLPAVAVRTATRPSAETLAGNTVTVVKRRTTAASAPAFNPNLSSETDAFQAVENDLQSEFKKPAEQIDVKGLLARYRALKISDESLKAWADYRIKYLQSILDRQSDKAAVADILRDVDKGQVDIERKIAEIKSRKPAEGEQRPTRYDAQGVLMASSLFPGGATGPKRYVVVDPVTQRTDSYVQCTSGKVVLDDYIGKFVGITGEAKFDRGLKLNVIDAAEVLVLSDKAEIPVPSRPAVVEGTPPAPKSDLPPVLPPKAESPVTPSAESKPAAPVETKAEPKVVVEPATKAETAVDGAKPDMGDAPATEPAKKADEPEKPTSKLPSLTSKPAESEYP